MRHEKALVLLQLARRLAGSAEGLSIDEIAEAQGVCRRTAERLRNALEQMFPQMETLEGPPVRRYRIPGGLDGLFQAPTAEELAALRTSSEALRASGATDHAAALESLEAKVRASMRSSALRRLVPDVEALVQAEMIAVQAGPRPVEDEAVLALLRHALKAMKAVSFVYDGGTKPGTLRKVTPYGLMFGRTNYLIAAEEGSSKAKSWRLDRIRTPKVLDEPGAPPEDFSLASHAARSFGVFQAEPEDVVLRILPGAAKEARRWRFHPDQRLDTETDGSVIISFRASGMLELAWHLFTWGDQVEIIAPDSLRDLMISELARTLLAHRIPRPLEAPVAKIAAA